MAHTKSMSHRVAKKRTKAPVKVGRQPTSSSVNGRAPAASRRKRQKTNRQDTKEKVSATADPTYQEAPPAPITPAPETVETPAADGRASEPMVNEHDQLLVTLDRRQLPDRRSGEDRRQQNIPVAVERRQLDRRAKVPRRRQIDPTTCERDYTPEEIEFMIALDEYKRSSGRMFPTCSEILEVVKKLGYEKRVVPPAEEATAQTSSETAAVPAITESGKEQTSEVMNHAR